MNPRLIKFAVELQNSGEKKEEETKNINFKGGSGKKFFRELKLAKVTVPITKD